MDYPSNLTMEQVAKSAGLKVYDTARPQQWEEQAVALRIETNQYVWCYDEEYLMGRPVNVVAKGAMNIISLAVNELVAVARGDDWEKTPQSVKDALFDIYGLLNNGIKDSAIQAGR